MRIPALGEDMSMLINKDTPAEAPAVRNIWAGLDG